MHMRLLHLRTPHRFASRPLGLAIAAAVAMAIAGHASANGDDSLQFSEGFLIGGQAIDMQRYAQGNPMEPGVYPLDVVVNGQFHDTRDITFVAAPAPLGATPCLPAGLVRQLPLKEMFLAELDQDDEGCVALPSLIDGATVEFDESNLQLLVNVPQAAQARDARGYVAPALRDHGVTAAFFDYNINHSRNQGQQATYLGLNTVSTSVNSNLAEALLYLGRHVPCCPRPRSQTFLRCRCITGSRVEFTEVLVTSLDIWEYQGDLVVLVGGPYIARMAEGRLMDTSRGPTHPS